MTGIPTANPIIKELLVELSVLLETPLVTTDVELIDNPAIELVPDKELESDEAAEVTEAESGVGGVATPLTSTEPYLIA